MNDKMSQNNSLLVCKVCNLIYELPVKLPCGKSLCRTHLLDSNGALKAHYDCIFCENVHLIPPNGFRTNFHIRSQVDSNVHLKQNQVNLKNRINEKLYQLKSVYDKFDENESFLSDFFAQLENQINLHREQLKSQIDKLADDMLTEIKQLENQLKSELSQLNTKLYGGKSFETFKSDLDLKFRASQIGIEKLENYLDKMSKKIIDLEIKSDRIVKDRLKSYEFVPNQIHSNLFGLLKQSNLQIIACFKDGRIGIRDLNENSRFKYFNGKHEESVNCMQISMDKTKLISGGKDGTIKIWDIKSGNLITSIQNANDRSIRCMINSSLPNEFITGSNNSEIRIWDLNTFTCKLLLGCHSSRVLCLEMLRDDVLLSGSSDQTFKISDLKSFECILTLKDYQSYMNCMTKITDFSFASGHSNGSIKIWQSSGNHLMRKKTFTFNTIFIKQLKYNSSLNVLISLNDQLLLWNLKDYSCLAQLCHNKLYRIDCFQLLPDDLLISMYENQTIEIFCLKSAKSLKNMYDKSNKAVSVYFFYLNL